MSGSLANPQRITLVLPSGDFAAYLFDCDGTIVDSMPLHFIAWNKALAEWNCELSEKDFYAWGGIPVKQIIADLNRKHGLHMPVEEVAHRKENYYFQILPQLKAIPEVLDIIHEQYGKVPFAVVSGSTRESVVASLEALHLLEKFPVIVGADEYRNPKPDPEAFLLAAARLGVAPQSCLVFEDTDMGIQAATAAGMASVKILQPWERNTAK
jgi:HAD superfamily hydrolase (TIGR01509 family)